MIRCDDCGRELTDALSVRLRRGPVCRGDDGSCGGAAGADTETRPLFPGIEPALGARGASGARGGASGGPATSARSWSFVLDGDRVIVDDQGDLLPLDVAELLRALARLVPIAGRRVVLRSRGREVEILSPD